MQRNNNLLIIGITPVIVSKAVKMILKILYVVSLIAFQIAIFHWIIEYDAMKSILNTTFITAIVVLLPTYSAKKAGSNRHTTL